MASKKREELKAMSLDGEFRQDFIGKILLLRDIFEPLPDVYLEGEMDERVNPNSIAAGIIHTLISEIPANEPLTWAVVQDVISKAKNEVAQTLAQRLPVEPGETRPKVINPNSPAGKALWGERLSMC